MTDESEFSKQDEDMVSDYLENRQLTPQRFTRKERQKTKTPDFRVFEDGNLLFFCEVKSLAPDSSIDDAFEKAPAGTIAVSNSGPTPIFNRLTSDINHACKQFDAVNPGLEHPNVLIFVNHYDQCNVGALQLALNGGTIDLGSTQGRLFSEKIASRTSPKIARIAVCGYFGLYEGNFSISPSCHSELVEESPALPVA